MREAIECLWPGSSVLLLKELQRLRQAEQGRHWAHTRKVAAIMESLIAGPQHPAWAELAGPLRAGLTFIEWVSQNSRRLAPDWLRLIALFHDLGKGVSLAGHEEISFRLLAQAAGTDSPSELFPPGSAGALIAGVVRHHAGLSLLQLGEASELIWAGLIQDIRDFGLDREQFLAALSLITVADWLAYDLLTPPIMSNLLASIGFLREALRWGCSAPETRFRLWPQAARHTRQRLGNLLAFPLATQPAAAERPPLVDDRLAGLIAAACGVAWPEFQTRFALLRIEGGYSIFTRCLELTSDLEHQLLLAGPQLRRWLPSPAQAQAFETGRVPGYLVNLRPVTSGLAIKGLERIQAELADIRPVVYNPAESCLGIHLSGNSWVT